jgi:hypothetical protein
MTVLKVAGWLLFQPAVLSQGIRCAAGAAQASMKWRQMSGLRCEKKEKQRLKPDA